MDKTRNHYAERPLITRREDGTLTFEHYEEIPRRHYVQMCRVFPSLKRNKRYLYAAKTQVWTDDPIIKTLESIQARYGVKCWADPYNGMVTVSLAGINPVSKYERPNILLLEAHGDDGPTFLREYFFGLSRISEDLDFSDREAMRAFMWHGIGDEEKFHIMDDPTVRAHRACSHYVDILTKAIGLNDCNPYLVEHFSTGVK